MFRSHQDEEGGLSKLEELRPNAAVRGILPDALITVVSVAWHGSDALTLVYRAPNGRVADEILYRHDEPRLEIAEAGRPWSFDGDGALFRLVSEAHRIRLAHLWDDEFRQRLARAREAGVEANLEEVEELLRRANNKNISVVRELAHHLRWKASKLKPRNYGDRLSAEVSGPEGAPFKLSPIDWDALIRKVTGQEPATTVPERGTGGECSE
jgi:Bacteriophage Sf6, terminase small subunit-like